MDEKGKLAPLPLGDDRAPKAADVVESQQNFAFPSDDFDSVLAQEHDIAQTTVAETPSESTPEAAVVAEREVAAEVPGAPQAQEAAPAAKDAPPATTVAEQPKPEQSVQPTTEHEIDLGGQFGKVPRVTVNAAISEALTFRDVFKMDATRAKETWGPIIESIAADPAKGAYLDECLAYYDKKRGSQAAPEQAAIPQDYEARQRIARVEAELNQRRFQESAAQLDNERRTLVAKYPQLADETLMTMVAQYAYNRYMKDQSYTLTRAVTDLESYINRFGAQPAPQVQAAPVAEQAPVPALVGSGGASPNGSRHLTDLEPKSFADPDDALADWEQSRSQYGFN